MRNKPRNYFISAVACPWCEAEPFVLCKDKGKITDYHYDRALVAELKAPKLSITIKSKGIKPRKHSGGGKGCNSRANLKNAQFGMKGI